MPVFMKVGDLSGSEAGVNHICLKFRCHHCTIVLRTTTTTIFHNALQEEEVKPPAPKSKAEGKPKAKEGKSKAKAKAKVKGTPKPKAGGASRKRPAAAMEEGQTMFSGVLNLLPPVLHLFYRCASSALGRRDFWL
jgi:hypothetical protein